ncbi:MAG: HIT family hydrolase, partial [Akkermansiaceae bacterium]|nr:HIT family hydrolase [Akkermansiaceae bacterium]
QRALDDALSPHGYNLGANLGRDGGAGVVGHFHLHVVPRWRGDSSFMSATANARVLPQALEETWARLRELVNG